MSRKFCFGCSWQCYGQMKVEVPDSCDTLKKAEEYVREHWDDYPLPSGDYVEESDEPDFEDADLEGGLDEDEIRGKLQSVNNLTPRIAEILEEAPSNDELRRMELDDYIEAYAALENFYHVIQVVDKG